MTKAKSFYKRGLAVLFLFTFVFIISIYLMLANKIYPFTYISGVYVGAKTIENAEEKLAAQNWNEFDVLVTYSGKTFRIRSSQIAFEYEIEKTVQNAFQESRSSLIKEKNFPLQFKYNEEQLHELVASISHDITSSPIYPSIKVNDGKISINKGAIGTEINYAALKLQLDRQVAIFSPQQRIEIPITMVDPTISDEQALVFQQRAEKLKGRNLIVKYQDKQTIYKDEGLFNFLSFAGYSQANIQNVSTQLAQGINQKAEDPEFVSENNRVTKFNPGQRGIAIVEEEFVQRIKNGMSKLETSNDQQVIVEVPVAYVNPDKELSETNNLGINELIAKGDSKFAHSIPSRVHNVNLAASKIDGTLIKPGETFSFTKTLGDISKFTGYQQAYIIQNGQTVLGDGGGVCQVSTTLFRAALNAGLPIAERVAHAYRVGYYEQDSLPGIDATIYSPSPDLKIVNDTPGYILIKAKTDTVNYSLEFELYGTSDGRKATLSKPVVSDQSPPPPDLYTDDPTLRAGQIKQVDFAAWGAKVHFDYSVERDGKIIYSKTFYSNYQPWQAKFLRGTKV